MGFAVRDLSVLAYANGFTLWHYKSGADLLPHTKAEGFFNDASDMMAVGDMIAVSGRDGGVVLVVSRADRAVVHTTPLA